jgi:RNA-binding protein Musashi
MHKPKRTNAGYPKVFLGGLPANVTESDLRAFFVRYGQVMEVVIMYDQEKKKSRGFGFLSVSHNFVKMYTHNNTSHLSFVPSLTFISDKQKILISCSSLCVC